MASGPRKEMSYTGYVEIDQEISQLSSIFVRQYLSSWFSQISPDQQIYAEIDTLLRDIGLAVTERIQRIDVGPLLAHKISSILQKWIEDGNLARERTPVNPSTMSRHIEGIEVAFRELQHHPGTAFEEEYLAYLADSVLTELMPSEVVVSQVAYSFLRTLFSDLVLKTTVSKLSEVWFWDELILLWMPESEATTTRNQLEAARATGKVWYWQSWYAFLALLSFLMDYVPHIGTTLMAVLTEKISWTCLQFLYGKSDECEGFQEPEHPIHTLSIYPRGESLYESCVPELMAAVMAPSFSPLTMAILVYFLLPILDWLFGPILIRMVEESIRQHLKPEVIANVLRKSRETMFPDGVPAEPRRTPDQGEQAGLRRRVNASCAARYISLPFFTSQLMNKTLIYTLIDCLVSEFCPDLNNVAPDTRRKKILQMAEAMEELAGMGGLRTTASSIATL